MGASTITPELNGFYFVEFAFTADSTTNFNINIRLKGAANADSYIGDGVSGIKIKDIQLEAGAYSTSRILTTTSTSTRIADSLILSGATSVIGQTEGVLYWQGSTISGIGTDLMIVGDLANSVFIAIDASRQIRLGIRANNTLVVNLFSSPISSTSNIKISAAYKSGDIVV